MSTAEGYAVSVRRDVEMRARDGVILRSDVYTPDAQGTFPVLVCRTPYDKSAPLNASFAELLARRGYIAVTNDIRGLHTSDGDLVWMYDPASIEVEAHDGHDCVEWAAKLPQSDGRVGTFGVSYSSWLALCLLGDVPPSLAAMMIGGMTSSLHEATFGIMETGRRFQWCYQIAAGMRGRGGSTTFPSNVPDATWDWMTNLRDKWVWRLPLDSVPNEVFGDLSGPLRTFYEHHGEEIWPFMKLHEKVSFPVCTHTGWWDRFSLSVNGHENMVKVASNDLAARHRLVVGPWPHSPFDYTRRIGPVDYGADADVAYADLVAGWYDFTFFGKSSRLFDEAPVKLFMVNENAWRNFETWPPPGMQETLFYLHSGGSAATPEGDGRLSVEAPGDEQPDTYAYDPADPVMSLMGEDAQMKPVDQRPNEGRRDVLVFATAPLEERLTLAGPLRCQLWASSDAPDTDFCVKLIEVRPDGPPINLSSGIMRARFRNGYDREELMVPGQSYLFDIEMLPVGIRLEPGSRLRLDITSSDFPAFDRNHNTGDDFWSSTELRIARQTIFHDTERPSRLVLPVISS